MGWLLWELLVLVSPPNTLLRSIIRLVSLLGVLLIKGEESGRIYFRLLLKRIFLRTGLNDCFRLITRGYFPTDSQQGLGLMYKINMLLRLDSDFSADNCYPSL